MSLNSDLAKLETSVALHICEMETLGVVLTDEMRMARAAPDWPTGVAGFTQQAVGVAAVLSTNGVGLI